MRTKLCLAAAAILVMGMCAGCGKKTTQAPVGGGLRIVRGVVLPNWAPRNPSPEFLRAARILRPIPDEAFTGRMSGLERQAQLRRVAPRCIQGYEFFGTLSDEQIRKLKASGEIRIPVRRLTASQRKAFDSWADREILVHLYKGGAAQDLSNVDAGFQLLGGHQLWGPCWGKRVDGSSGRMVGGTLAYM